MKTEKGKSGRYTYSEKRIKYNMEYQKENQKRIPLDVQKKYFETVLKPAADAAGEPMNTYIKKAIEMRMEHDGFKAKKPLVVGTIYEDPDGIWKVTKIDGDDITIIQIKEGAEDYGVRYGVPLDEVTPFL